MKFAVIVALTLALCGASNAAAEPSVTPPHESGMAPEAAPTVDTMPSFGDRDPDLSAGAPPGQHYVAEIVDSIFTVGPAEFFALELPKDPIGARAAHVLGTFSVTDKKGDIQIRLFRARDYQAWLKKRGGSKAGAMWTSKRSRNVTLDQDLPPDGPFVVLLDNGYSMRTTKHLRAQMQIQYEWTDGQPIAVGRDSVSVQAVEDIITPRANTEEDIPPPPPPPPDEGSR